MYTAVLQGCWRRTKPAARVMDRQHPKRCAALHFYTGRWRGASSTRNDYVIELELQVKGPQERQRRPNVRREMFWAPAKRVVFVGDFWRSIASPRRSLDLRVATMPLFMQRCRPGANPKAPFANVRSPSSTVISVLARHFRFHLLFAPGEGEALCRSTTRAARPLPPAQLARPHGSGSRGVPPRRRAWRHKQTWHMPRLVQTKSMFRARITGRKGPWPKLEGGFGIVSALSIYKPMVGGGV